jgi:hypothetical protein
MRVHLDRSRYPQAMAGAWHVNAHREAVADFFSTSQLVATVFELPERELIPGQRLRTIGGRFDVESVRDEPGLAEVVLRTDAPGLEARFGMTATESPSGGSVVLYTSVHPHSWVGRAYYRLIEPFHHVVMERFLLARLRRAAARRERVRPPV